MLATFSVNSTKVASAQDYFAVEQNNVIDYSEAQSNIGGVDDRQNAGLDDDNLVSPSVSGGSYNFTTTASSQIYLLHPGVVDGENDPVNRAIGVVPEDTTGETIPIDTSKYFILNLKITAPTTIPNVELVGGAAFQGNIQWDNGRAVPSNTATRSFFLYPGTNIYSFNLKTISLATNASGAWTGNISGLRLYPSNNANVPLSIDWVTLTGENQASVPVSVTGATGNVQIGVSTDGNAANIIKLNKPTGNTDGEFSTRRQLVGPTAAGSLTSVDVSMLAPGTYFLHALDTNGNTLSGTTARQFTINAAPSSKILTPSFYGDLSRDYATTVRGDAWDFSQASDFKVPFVSNPAEYGVPTLVTDPTTSVAGQISNNGNSWMRYDNSTASVAANRGDPQFLLSQPTPIDPKVYKNLTVRQLLDRTRDIGLGAVTRFGWSDTNPLAAGFTQTIVQTDDIIAQNGVRDLHVRLPDVKLEPLAPSQKKWSDSTTIQYLRIDPHEYIGQTITYIDQVWLTPNERTVNGLFNITWQTADPNSDPVTISKIYLDADRVRFNGGEVTIATNPTNNGTFQLNTAAIAGLMAGTYNVLFEVTDGLNSSFRYSSGVLDVVINQAPVLDASGNPFAIMGVGSRQTPAMRQGTPVSDILARGANGNPITDANAGALRGIAITAVDSTLGTLQYTLVPTNPQESDWTNVTAAGAVSNSSALLLPTTARLRFTTGLTPHHAAGAPFLPLESKLDTGFTFRAWDQTSGTVLGRADTTANGGSTAFSAAAETVKIYFETRLFRSFNKNAELNVYTLEAEFNALTANPAFMDLAIDSFTGFSILMTPVPELGTVPLFRMYFGVQFNDDGTQTDMGYRYLTSSAGEAGILEGLGRADLRASRQGAYFREIGDPANPGDMGVNNGTAIIGYIYSTQQPGTLEMRQIYRQDQFPKPTRPAGTTEGSPPSSTKVQEQGDHVYTTNTPFETGRPGTWRVEAFRGFVRELTPSAAGVGSALAAESVAVVASVSTSMLAAPLALPAVAVERGDVGTVDRGNVFTLVATGTGVVPAAVGPGTVAVVDEARDGEVESVEAFEAPSVGWCDDAFADLDLVATCGLGV